MEFSNFFWEHPLLVGYHHTFAEGKYLFRQGDPAKSMFILVSGLAQLLAVRGSREYPIEFLAPGQFLGEQAVLDTHPYRRYYSVKAKTEVKVIDLNAQAMSRIESSEPRLMIDLLKGMFQVASGRLSRANRVIPVLRSHNNRHRFVHLLLYFVETSARPVKGGKEVFIPVERIRFYLDMPALEIEEAFRHLEAHRVIRSTAPDFWLVPDEAKLAADLPSLLHELVSLPFL